MTEAKKPIELGLDVSGRIRACPGFNPNCVSTSSVTSKHALAWRSGENKTGEEVAALIVAGAKKSIPNVVVAENIAKEHGEQYLRILVPTKMFPDRPDIVEFLIKPEGVIDRNWDGDEAGAVILYRSIAGDVRYLYPFTTPLPDNDAQPGRMKSLRKELGFKLVGCELVECYEE